MGTTGPPGYCDQNACMGYNVGVQLPSGSFQNYEEAEQEDPYRYPAEYYQPHDHDVELRSPGVHRSARSLAAGAGAGAGSGPRGQEVQEEEEQATRSSLTDRLKRGAQKSPGTK